MRNLLSYKLYSHPETGVSVTIAELSAQYGITSQRINQMILRHNGNVKSAIDRLLEIDRIGLKGTKLMARRLYLYNGKEYARAELYELTSKKASSQTFYAWLSRDGVEKALQKMADYNGYPRRVKRNPPADPYTPIGSRNQCYHGEEAEIGNAVVRRTSQGIKEIVGHAEPAPPPLKPRATTGLSAVVKRGLELGRIKCAETMRAVNLMLCETCHVGCFR